MTDIDIIGVFRRDGEDLSVRMEKHFDTGREDLWSALTEPARLARWFADVTGDLRPDGEFLIVFDPLDPSQRVTGAIEQCLPTERLSVSWRIEGLPTSTVSVELRQDGDGTLLVLEEARLPLSQAAGYGAGWQAYLEQLAAALAGGDGHGAVWDERWSALLPAYREHLEGAAPERKA